MYAFLLIFGVVIAATGVALIGSGISVQEHTFDPTIMTPGFVALIGGLGLVGLGFAVRALGRIERALARHSAPLSTARPDVADAVNAAIPAEAIAPELPFPAEPAAETVPQPVLPEISTAAVNAAAQTAERLREKFPGLVRIENAPVVAESDVSLLPKPLARADEEVAAANDASATGEMNGAPSRLEAPVRLPTRPQRVRNFDALWPRRKQPGQMPAAAPSGAAPPSVRPAAPVGPAPSAEPTSVVPEVSATVSVLKSGVVDGMAYTLFSDGSIEAQLPQGALRFGSINELRNHIEQSA
jgi:hypothetical protein